MRTWCDTITPTSWHGFGAPLTLHGSEVSGAPKGPDLGRTTAAWREPRGFLCHGDARVSRSPPLLRPLGRSTGGGAGAKHAMPRRGRTYVQLPRFVRSRACIPPLFFLKPMHPTTGGTYPCVAPLKAEIARSRCTIIIQPGRMGSGRPAAAHHGLVPW